MNRYVHTYMYVCNYRGLSLFVWKWSNPDLYWVKHKFRHIGKIKRWFRDLTYLANKWCKRRSVFCACN